MNLTDLNNPYSDKNFVHSYLPLYDTLLQPIKETAINILEIGVNTGGSIKLWYDFFTNANIYGVDIQDAMTINDLNFYAEQYKFGEKNMEDMKNIVALKENNRIILNLNQDAYNSAYVQSHFIDKNIQFDFIIDDGPHTLTSQKKTIQLYSKVLSNNGILIIEDVQDMTWIDELKKITPENLKQYIKVYDLRNNKGRYDDIVFTIDLIQRNN